MLSYEKCCRNCEHNFLKSCHGCDTFGDNKYQNFQLREELAAFEAQRQKHMKVCITRLRTQINGVYQLDEIEATLNSIGLENILYVASSDIDLFVIYKVTLIYL